MLTVRVTLLNVSVSCPRPAAETVTAVLFLQSLMTSGVVAGIVSFRSRGNAEKVRQYLKGVA